MAPADRAKPRDQARATARGSTWRDRVLVVGGKRFRDRADALGVRRLHQDLTGWRWGTRNLLMVAAWSPAASSHSRFGLYFAQLTHPPREERHVGRGCKARQRSGRGRQAQPE